MKRPNRIAKLIWFALICCTTVNYAQSPFKWKAALPRVDSNGYYRINLQPALTAKSKADLSDLRIVGPDNGSIAYLKTSDRPQNAQAKFIQFPQVAGAGKNDTTTVFVVNNISGTVVSTLWIKLRNKQVERRITITGSDDLQHWFAIKEDSFLTPASVTDDKGTYELKVDFPASNYRYLKLAVNNGHKTPIYILQAGIYNYLSSKGRFVPVPIQYKQTDSGQTTRLHIRLSDAYPVEKIILKVAGTGYFKRAVKVYTNNGSVRNWVTEQYITNDDPDINLSVKSAALDIEIANNDDHPLAFATVIAMQQERFVLAVLETGRSYYLLTGNSQALPPRYDLQYIKSEIEETALPLITHQKIIANPGYKIVQAKATKNYSWAIWAAIGLALGVLLTLTIKMAKEVGKK